MEKIRKSGTNGMSLYRVMLVDDEEDVRQAIARKIDWEEIGFEVVASAENGQ